MNKFIHYNTQAAFEADSATGRVSPGDIVFVRSENGSSGDIYTHGIKFTGAPSNIATQEDLQTLRDLIASTQTSIESSLEDSLANYYNKTEVVNMINGVSPEIEVATIQDIIDIFENRYVPSDAGDSGTTIDPHDPIQQ